MVRETWVQSQVASYQKFLKWCLIFPCLTLSNIRYVSRVKWSNSGKGVVPSPTSRCSSYWKGRLLVTNFTFTYMTSSIPIKYKWFLNKIQFSIIARAPFWWAVLTPITQIPSPSLHNTIIGDSYNRSLFFGFFPPYMKASLHTISSKQRLCQFYYNIDAPQRCWLSL